MNSEFTEMFTFNFVTKMFAFNFATKDVPFQPSLFLKAKDKEVSKKKERKGKQKRNALQGLG